jgi:hypothetical protein
MIRVRLTFIHKILTAIALVILLSTPLAAMEREAPTADQASFAWLSSLLEDAVAWLTGGIVSPPPGSGGATTQGSCAIDPFGCPFGG